MFGVEATSSVLSSDIESVSVIDSEDTCSRSAGHKRVLLTDEYKKLSYRRETVQCLVSLTIFC